MQVMVSVVLPAVVPEMAMAFRTLHPLICLRHFVLFLSFPAANGADDEVRPGRCPTPRSCRTGTSPEVVDGGASTNAFLLSSLPSTLFALFRSFLAANGDDDEVRPVTSPTPPSRGFPRYHRAGSE